MEPQKSYKLKLSHSEAWQELLQKWQQWNTQVGAKDRISFHNWLCRKKGMNIGGWHVTVDFFGSIKLIKLKTGAEETFEYYHKLSNACKTNIDPHELKRFLTMWERIAHELVEAFCDGDIDIDLFDEEAQRIMQKIYRKLGDNIQGLYIDMHPKEPALKIKKEICNIYFPFMETDLKGCGILVPDAKRKTIC